MEGPTANPIIMNRDREEFGVEYKLQLMAYRDRIFQARKRLQDSKDRMAALEKKLEDYLRNKENQIAEVMHTAHINAQRIEAQARIQTEAYLQEMDEELLHTHKALEMMNAIMTQFNQEVKIPPDLTANYSNIYDPHLLPDNTTHTATEIAVSLEASSPVNMEQILEAELEEKVMLPSPGHDKKTGEEETVSTEPVLAKLTPYPQVQRRAGIRRAAIKNHMRAGNTSQISARDIILQEIEDQIIKGSEPLPAAQIEQNERMHLDAFVDIRYFEDIGGQKEMHQHALQITAEVVVPVNNYSVRYTKVSSDIVAALQRYDNIVLNDVYPFNFIEPNLTNISRYFFNCLEDVLALMDLGLHSIKLHELPDLNIEVNSRSTEIDQWLHNSEDMLDDIRRILPQQVKVEPEPHSSLKGRLNQIIKKKNLFDNT
jgi:hypothetical protein